MRFNPKIYGLLLFLLSLVSNATMSQKQACSFRDFSFQPGEEARYCISYNWFVFWTDVGEVLFSVKESRVSDIPCLHLLAVGATYKSWDWFFKVRDRYESWVYPGSLKPIVFNRDVYEGGYTIKHRYVFDHRRGVAYMQMQNNDKPLVNDTLTIPECTFDLVSILYYVRNLDYSHCKVNDTIPITILLDDGIYNIFFRFLGTEKKKIKKLGVIDCIKFSAMLIQGSVFKSGERMFIWVTNDKNRIPVYIESPIIVGSVRGTLIDIKGNKYPLGFKK
ncbi:MAG: DUF3108 domain-containing protein [Bacteroidales bacterium]|nr:DUF3108 domain-containing protein [Bacteroidales bacterium]